MAVRSKETYLLLSDDDFSWSWDYREFRDRGFTTEQIFEANYPKRIPRKAQDQLIRKVVREIGRRYPIKKKK